MTQAIGKAKYHRETRETKIEVSLNLYGQNQISVASGLGYVDHMLTLMAFWAGFDLELKAIGDLEVDAHHTLEDIGLCLGETFQKSLQEKSQISRVGWAKIPMDEALSEIVVDLSGRPYLVYQDDVLPQAIFGQEKDVWREFFKSFAFRAGMNLHIRFLYGKNGHHLIESAFKGLGLSLNQALLRNRKGILSTKGCLD